MARLPVDPKLARMLVVASGHACLREVLIIVSALSIQDPRESYGDNRQQAQERHAIFLMKSQTLLVWLIFGMTMNISANLYRKIN
ncbi:MAG: hypothetical protein CM1200mP40_34100 [Gammaproteobacteria bacterium]|nr:MAG: hypothetical protein CM1200mP40_34100 [Gammaproteobacteria bacterium]